MIPVLVNRTIEEVSESVDEAIRMLFDEKGISDNKLIDELVEAAIAGMQTCGIQFKRSGYHVYTSFNQ